MNNCVLRLLVFIENVLSIYRNYSSFTGTKKILVSLRIAVDIILIITIAAIHIPTIEYNYPDKFRLTYFCLNITFSLYLILLAASKSTKFNNLINDLETIHTYFSEDEIYVKNNLQKRKHIKVILFVYGIISLSTWIYLVTNITFLSSTANTLFILVVYFICEIRYVIEYVVLYGILAVLSEQVKSITRNVAKEPNTIVRRLDHERQIEVIQPSENFYKWKQIYSTLKDCSNSINKVFGVQISITLIIVTIYNIILCYSSFANYLSLSHEYVAYTIYREILFMMALFLLSRGAHTAQKSVEELQRNLAGLLILSTADQKIYKIIRDFLRLIIKQPLKTQAFGSVTINMSLVPKLMMFCTSYTVMALQFNNVM